MTTRTLAGVATRTIAALLLATLAGSAAASGDGGIQVYRGGGQGKVIFDGRVHAAKGFSCRDCHTQFVPTGKQLFATQRRGLIAMAAHTTDTQCFACHDGKRAFNDCDRCHRGNAP